MLSDKGLGSITTGSPGHNSTEGVDIYDNALKETKLEAKESAALPPVPTHLNSRGGERSGKRAFHGLDGGPGKKKKKKIIIRKKVEGTPGKTKPKQPNNNNIKKNAATYSKGNPMSLSL